MTERESEGDRDYPDGSVGRYVREQWGTTPQRPSRGTRPYVGPVQPAPPAEDPPEDEVVPAQHSESAVAVEATGPSPAVPQEPPTRSFPGVLPPPPSRPTARPPFASVPPASVTVPPPAAPPPAPAVAAGPPPLPVTAGVTPPRGIARWTEPGAVAAQEA